MTSPSPNASELLRLGRRMRRHSGMFAVLGGSLIVAGSVSVAFPYLSPVVIGALAGWLLWLVGAVMIGVTLLVGARGSLGAALLASLVAIGAGAFMLANPMAGAFAVTLLLAAVLIFEGAFELVLAFDLRPWRVWRWLIGSATASALGGLAILAGAADSRLAMAWTFGLALTTSGAAMLAMAFPRRRRSYSAKRRASSAMSWAGGSPRMPST